MDQAFTLASVARVACPSTSTLLSAIAGLSLDPGLKRIGIKADASGQYFDPAATAAATSETIPTSLLTWPSNKTSAGNIRVFGDGTTKISIYQFV